MEENRKRELASLLSEALGKLTITYRRSGNITLQTYRKLFLSSANDDRTNMLRVNCKISIIDDSVRERLLDFFRVELSGYVSNDRILSNLYFFSGGWGNFPLDYFAPSLCRISILWGIQTAIAVFARTIEKNQICFQEMMAFDGLKIEREVELLDGFRLMPLPEWPEELPDFVPDCSFDLHSTRTLATSKTLLIIDCFLYPVFYTQINDNPKSFRITNREIEKLYIHDFSMILSMISNRPVRPILHWQHVDRKELLLYEVCSGRPGSALYNREINAFSRQIPDSDIRAEEFVDLCEMFLNFDQQEIERLKIAIHRWIESKADKNIVNKMIDLGIAFELLYLDNNNTAQLSYTFRIRVAWYLGRNAEDRKRLLALCKTIYDCRSKAVHAARLKDTVEIEGKKIPIEQFIEQAQDLCHQSMLKIIHDGKFPDWDSVVVGENAT